MRKNEEIPSALIQQWEREAIKQKIPYTEFRSFLKMKEENYWQGQGTRKESRPIFANDARNKLTEYGQKVALETLLAIPEVERACKFARFDFEDLKEKLSKGFATIEQKEMFLQEREHWFTRLKGRMKDLRISKETLLSYGLNLKVCTTFAYQQI